MTTFSESALNDGSNEFVAVALIRLPEAYGKVAFADLIVAVWLAQISALIYGVGNPKPIIYITKLETSLYAPPVVVEGPARLGHNQLKSVNLDEAQRAF